jgi:hypothetical protein
MAIKTKCQTPGAIYRTIVGSKIIEIKVEVPFVINLDLEEVELLEANLHNAVELALAPIFDLHKRKTHQ